MTETEEIASVFGEVTYEELMAELAAERELMGKLIEALNKCKTRCTGERSPNWTDDWQTTYSRSYIMDVVDYALSLVPADRRGL